MPLQFLTVAEMDTTQLCSFLTAKCSEDYWESELMYGPQVFYGKHSIIEWVQDVLDDNVTDNTLESSKAAIEQEYPETYPFDCWEYTPDVKSYEQKQEEKNALFEERNLPFLGLCKVYPTLRWIVWTKVDYDEDGNILNDSGYNYKRICSEYRMSFENYEALLQAEQEKIVASLLLVKIQPA